MDKAEAKRAARKAAKEDNGPLLEEEDALAGAGEPPEAAIDEADEADEADDADEAAAEDEEEEDLPDLLLRESARIVYDMIELGRDEPTLARQFSLLGKDEVSEGIN